MGMYAPLGEEDYKLSGLIATAVRDLHPEEVEEGCFVTIRKDEVSSLLAALDRKIRAFRIINEDGTVSAQSCYTLSVAAQFAGELVVWLSTGETEEIVFC